MRGRGRNVTAKDFETIKALIGLNLSARAISEVTGRSPTLVSVIKKVDSYKAYKQQNAERIAKSANHDPALPNPVVQEDMATIMQKLTSLEKCFNDLLKIFQEKEAKANVTFWKR